MKAVEMKNVSFSYGNGTSVLDNIGFCAEYGEVTLLSGLSGEGKSTLMYAASGVIPNVVEGKLEGEILIAGENIRGRKLGYICRKVGVVLQNADEQIVHGIIEDEIAFGCENLAYPPERIERQIRIVCELLNLDPRDGTRTLSGGQKQRLITASTLAMGQKIVILDEPLANLDKEGAAKLMETLRSIAAAGYCVILIEHRLDMVLPYADRVWHISGGKAKEVPDREAYLKEQTARIEDGCAPFTGTAPVFEVKDAVFAVKKGRTVLSGVSCEIPKGGRTVLLGENGCGKTTFLRLLARLCKPTAGEILQHIDPKLKQKGKGSRKWFRKVGVVYQNPDYQLFMPTVRQELEFGAKSREYAEKIAALFGVRHLYERHPHSLSEGQKRRVSIAAVAAADPEVLLLDEPTVGQDYIGLCGMVRVLNELHEKSGNTMVVITHDVRCAEALCDRAVLLGGGKVMETGGKEIVRKYFSLE